jgi:hypothetical protein
MRFIPRPVIDQQYPRDAEHSYGQRDPEGAADRPHRYISVHAINPICDSFPKQSTARAMVPRFGARKTGRPREPFAVSISSGSGIAGEPALPPGPTPAIAAPAQFP